MAMSTAVQARWRIVGDFTRIPQSIQAIAATMMIDRTELSKRIPRIISILLVPFPTLARQFDELIQLFAAQYLGVHHACDEFFHGPLAEAINDLTHGPCRQAARWLSGTVYIRASAALVRQVTLIFKPAEHRPHA
jgi:hypothetical protein